MRYHPRSLHRTLNPHRRLLRSTPVTTTLRHLIINIIIITTIVSSDLVDICRRLHCKAQSEALDHRPRPFLSYSFGPCSRFFRDCYCCRYPLLLPSNANLNCQIRRPWRTALSFKLIFRRRGEDGSEDSDARAKREDIAVDAAPSLLRAVMYI